MRTDGLNVGLPEGQMGNSEVGHMNIGAGRVVWQQLALINKKFEDGSAADEKVIADLANYCIENNKPLHLTGLVSDGGVHSSMEHLISLCKIFTVKGVQHIFIHAFTDGRDTDPNSGKGFVQYLESKIENTKAKIASVIGRYYAMDRDNRWERVKLAYDLMVKGAGEKVTNLEEALSKSYEAGVTDEFVKPMVKVDAQGNPIAVIQDDDVVICFNFRTDRGREITTALTQKEFPEQEISYQSLLER